MLDVNRHQDLPDFLVSCVRTINKNHPKTTILSLSQKLNIPNSTLDRIVKGAVKKPSLNYALKIVREVCSEEDVEKFVLKYYPKMLDTLKKVYPGNYDVKFVKKESEQYFRDANSYELMMSVTSLYGVTKEEVLAEYGRKGLAKLEEMIGNGLIEMKDGRVSCSENVKFGQETTQVLLKNLVTQSYDIGNFGDKLNWLSVQYESLDREKALPVVHKIFVEANQKLREVFNDSKYHGKDIVWAGLCMDTMKRDDSLSSNGEVIQ